MSECVDQNLLTFILVAVCTPTYFKNPYLVSKLIEILFVINPAVQDRTQELYLRMISHPVAEEFLPSALMTFYTGKNYFCSQKIRYKTIKTTKQITQLRIREEEQLVRETRKLVSSTRIVLLARYLYYQISNRSRVFLDFF